MARLELALLGGFHAAIDGTPVRGFDGDKTRALLVYLAVEAAYPQRRDALAGLLWPDFSDEAARRNLRYTLFKLRQALGESEAGAESAPGFLLITPQTVHLDPAADLELDVAAFVGHIANCRAHQHRKLAACTTCHARFEQAAALYRGEFLNGFYLPDCQAFEEWLLIRRDGLHHAAIEVLGSLALYHEARTEDAAALEYTFRQLALEPWREEAHRQAMRLLARTGQRSVALAQYADCRKALAEELNAEPSPETTALYEQLKMHTSAADAGAPAGPAGRGATQLPHPLTPFIGREAEQRMLMEWLDSPDYSLLTIVGQGGAGKTRLALEAAAAQMGAFDDGVCWVPLAAVGASDTLDLLAGTIAMALNLHLGPAEDPTAQLAHYLRDKELLLVLDNFEQLLPGGFGGAADATQLLLTLLRDAPRLRLLVTSRERLGLQAESLLDLAGLPLPGGEPWPSETKEQVRSTGKQAADAAGPAMFTPDALLTSSAVQLFVERAKQANAAFTLSAETAPGVAEICRLVSGLPLGIVLAAAWVRHLPPARIAASIRANLDFLAGTARDAVPRHSSLRAVFDHSWALMSEEEQRVFQRLSVFRGGWDAEAAERVLGYERQRGAALRVLLSLVDKSLLRRAASERFDLHEVLRQYAAERLQEVPEELAGVRQAHAHYYLELAESAATRLQSDRQEEWLARLEGDHDNLRASLRWAQENGDAEVGLRLGAALSRFWFIRGYYSEGRAALAAVLSLSLLPASSHSSQPAELSRLKLRRAKALRGAGDLDRAMGDYTSALSLYEESLVIYRELGDKKDIAVALVRVALVRWEQGNHVLARSLYEESLAISRQLGDKKDISISLANLGLIAFETGDYPTARSLLEESLALDRGDKFGLAIRLNNLGNVALMQGDYANARSLHKEGLAMRRELGDKWGIAVCLIGLGGVAVLEGDAEKGTRLLGAAEALLKAVGVSLEADDRIPYEHGIASAHAQLGEAAFEQAWAEGHAMSMEEAIAYALDQVP